MSESPQENVSTLKDVIASINSTNAALIGVMQAQEKKLRNEERWTRFKAFVIMVPLVVFAALYGIWIAMAVEKETKDHVAIVRLDGVIASDKTNAERVMKPLRSAFASKYSRAVILEINSPGGSPSQALAMVEEIRNLKADHPGKKVYAVGMDSLASAAYMVALSADEIWVQPTTATGSIGVIYESFGFDPAVVAKYGVEHRLFTAGANKARFSPFRPLSDDDKQRMTGLLKASGEMFYGMVREARGEKLSKTVDLFTGDWWLGKEAVELGLADNLGGSDAVIRKYVPEIKNRREYSISPWQSLTEVLGAQAADGFLSHLTSLSGGFR